MNCLDESHKKFPENLKVVVDILKIMVFAFAKFLCYSGTFLICSTILVLQFKDQGFL